MEQKDNRCERCNQPIDDEQEPTYWLTIPGKNPPKAEIEICGHCMASFHAWLTDKLPIGKA